jgi:hypothetical protein
MSKPTMFDDVTDADILRYRYTTDWKINLIHWLGDHPEFGLYAAMRAMGLSMHHTPELRRVLRLRGYSQRKQIWARYEPEPGSEPKLRIEVTGFVAALVSNPSYILCMDGTHVEIEHVVDGWIKPRIYRTEYRLKKSLGVKYQPLRWPPPVAPEIHPRRPSN